METPSFALSKDGTTIAYAVGGEGAPILLLHGFASSTEQNWGSTGWIDRLLTHGYRVVTMDCRGHGLSDKPHDPAAYGPHMLEDILAVMHAAELPEADVMGYSMGAMLAIGLLMTHPERVRKIVAAGIGENYFDEQQAWRETVARAMLVEDISTIADVKARKFRSFAGQKGKDRRALSACMQAPRHIYTPQELKAARRPVLVVSGENDDLAGSPARLAGAFADGRALVLPGKDHMTAVGDPALKRAVLEYLVRE